MIDLLIALAGIAGATAASPATNGSALVGTWRLVSNEEHRADGTVTAVWGSSPAGSLMYQANGRMAIQLMDPRRGKFASEDRMAGSPGEVKQAFEGYLAYFGTYTVDDRAQTVTHKRIGNINPGGVGDFVRRYEFLSDDRLALVPQERTDLRAVRLTWERLK